MLYFAYGSNMLKSRLENQRNRTTPKIGSVVDLGAAKLEGYKIIFNKLGTFDGSGKTNIVQDAGSIVWGVIFELTDDQILRLDRVETAGYRRDSVAVNANGGQIDVATYFANIDYTREGLLPTSDYLGFLIDGAKEHSFPEDYTSFLENLPHR